MRSDEIDISHTTIPHATIPFVMIPYAMIFSTAGSPVSSCRITGSRTASFPIISLRAGSLSAVSRLTVSSES